MASLKGHFYYNKSLRFNQTLTCYEGIVALSKLYLTHRNAELEKLLEQANTYSNDGDFSHDAPSLIDAVPVEAIKDLMEEK